MTIPTGVMQLLKAEPLDIIEDFENGLAPDGGEWTNWERLSAHNHGGGLLGAPITVTAAMIPDGSITAGKLDPSVLAPYALTDGSKPFTGQVTMQADAVIRDALLFGEQSTALTPDASIGRSAVGALQLVRLLGVGVAPAPWPGGTNTVQIGPRGALASQNTPGTTYLTHNAAQGADGQWHPLVGGEAGWIWGHTATDLVLYRADAVGAGGTQALSTRLAIDTNGSMSLTPGGGSVGLIVGGAGLMGQGTELIIWNTAGGGAWRPLADSALNLGTPTYKYGTLYAATGTINTSLAEHKTGITPLDPAAALAAVRATTPVTFDYLAPERTADAYDLPPDPEQAQAVLEQRLRNGPLETAARHQAGVVLGDPAHPCDPMFQTGDGQTNPSNSVGILLAALKNLDSRLTSLGG